MEASIALQHWGAIAHARAHACPLPTIVVDKLRREVEQDEARMSHGRGTSERATLC